MRRVSNEVWRSVAIEDRGAFWAVYERSYCLYDPKEWVYKGYILKMSEPKSVLVERCKKCIANHDTYRPMAIGLGGLPI